MFLASGAILVLQVSLSRILSVISGYHAAFLVASLAMLGLTASAIDAYAAKTRDPASFDASMAARAGERGAVVLVVALLVLFQSGRLPDAFASLGSMVGVFGVLAAFHQGGFLVAFLLDRFANDVSRVYFVDLVGAAAGCVLAVVLLGSIPAPVVMVACAVALGVAGALLSEATRRALIAPALAFLALVGGLSTPLFAVHRAK